MPFLQRPGYQLHYRQAGDPSSPPLLLSHSLGSHLGMWEPQLEDLGRHFHLVLYDHPGHGHSGPSPALLSIDDFGRDALALLDATGLLRVAFCGLSLGGMIGIWLGAHAPERISRLVLACTTAKIVNPDLLRGRLDTIRRSGLADTAADIIGKWFTPGHLQSHPDTAAWARTMILQTRPEGYTATAEAVCRLDLRDAATRITAPTMVLYGENDRATPPDWNRSLAARIPGSVTRALPAAHMANVEAPGPFNAAVLEHLEVPKVSGASCP